MMSIVGCCDLTVSMRYHFCLFSALQAVPFIAMLRSDKLADLCWDMDWPATLVPAEFDSDDLVEHAEQLKRGAEALHAQLKQRVQDMRSRALDNAVALKVLTNGVGI
jgi:polysaccharide pyruvyl transferase WcaK-like protein